MKDDVTTEIISRMPSYISSCPDNHDQPGNSKIQMITYRSRLETLNYIIKIHSSCLFLEFLWASSFPTQMHFDYSDSEIFFGLSSIQKEYTCIKFMRSRLMEI
jgi:hypothetical protein